MKKSTFLHLRIPFSYYLMPIFLFALAVSGEASSINAALAFVILHFLIYPASNGYNSYFDKDEESIGGLKNPPPVSNELYRVALILDLIGIGLSLLISVEFAVMVFIYGMVSKAYSHPSVRLKKLPIVGWLAAGVFQGYFTFLACVVALKDSSIFETQNFDIQLPALLSSALLLGSYPMTQVYQHEEDGKRGDRTISRTLGVRGTFHFTAFMFSIAMIGFGYYFYSTTSVHLTLIFFGIMSPVLIYFGEWYLRVRKDEAAADFRSTMRLNFISATMLNLFFAWWWLMS